MSISTKKAAVNSIAGVLSFLLFATMASGETKLPKVLKPYLEPNRDYIAERVMVVSPEGIEKYIKLVEEGAAQNPEWYDEYSKAATPGEPLPYHKNLNLTPQDYQEYLALWAKRDFKVMEKVGMRVEQRNGKWRILVGGREGTAISLLRYDEGQDIFQSTNGEMKRIEDIDASASTLLGAWTGVEWRFEEESGLGRVKENFAVGKSEDGRFGFLVYRVQDVTTTNRVLKDQSVIIRIPLG